MTLVSWINGQGSIVMWFSRSWVAQRFAWLNHLVGFLFPASSLITKLFHGNFKWNAVYSFSCFCKKAVCLLVHLLEKQTASKNVAICSMVCIHRWLITLGQHVDPYIVIVLTIQTEVFNWAAWSCNSNWPKLWHIWIFRLRHILAHWLSPNSLNNLFFPKSYHWNWCQTVEDENNAKVCAESNSQVIL